MKLGKKSEEVSIKRYLGVASLQICAVNPNKEELSKLLGREIDKDTEYVFRDKNGDNVYKLVFWCKTDKSAKCNNGIELYIPLTLLLSDKTIVGTTSHKTQVIDIYGRTAWATEEDMKNMSIPQYSNGPARISTPYRAIKRGEEELLKLLKTWLNIHDVEVFNNNTGSWEKSKCPSEDCEVEVNLDNIFKGNLTELKEFIKAAKDYSFKAALGVKTTNDNRQYQDVFTREFAKNSASTYNKLQKAITNEQSSSSSIYASTEFSVEDLHEYAIQATDFNTPEQTVKNPWD